MSISAKKSNVLIAISLVIIVTLLEFQPKRLAHPVTPITECVKDDAGTETCPMPPNVSKE